MYFFWLWKYVFWLIFLRSSSICKYTLLLCIVRIYNEIILRYAHSYFCKELFDCSLLNVFNQLYLETLTNLAVFSQPSINATTLTTTSFFMTYFCQIQTMAPILAIIAKPDWKLFTFFRSLKDIDLCKINYQDNERCQKICANIESIEVNYILTFW